MLHTRIFSFLPLFSKTVVFIIIKIYNFWERVQQDTNYPNINRLDTKKELNGNKKAALMHQTCTSRFNFPSLINKQSQFLTFYHEIPSFTDPQKEGFKVHSGYWTKCLYLKTSSPFLTTT